MATLITPFETGVMDFKAGTTTTWPVPAGTQGTAEKLGKDLYSFTYESPRGGTETTIVHSSMITL